MGNNKIYVLLISTNDIENGTFDSSVVGVYDSLQKLKDNFSKLVVNVQKNEHICNIQDGFAQMYIEDIEEILIWYEEKTLNENY